jgi:1,4-alpha-glucan branching enzyme
MRYDVTRFTDYDIYLFKQGTHCKLYEHLGAHLMTADDGQKGVYFAVWAPEAREVSVIGDFNEWRPGDAPLERRADDSGIWEGFLPGVGRGEHYKYHVVSRHHGFKVEKGDPFAFLWETPPATSSRVWDLSYEWKDDEWMEKKRGETNDLGAPISIYEVHLGSWRRHVSEGNPPLSYVELAEQLADYVSEQGFTHVELLPVMEHPFYGSWGYQTTGYFAPTSRYGTPQELMQLIEALHEKGIGVLLDWVPSHFPSDEHGLVYFDGTHLYEHADRRKGFHPDWQSYIFNYGRNEVRSFLCSSAFFWLDVYHADGLRVDAVASMLYLDYSRKEGEWIPNEYGGRENLEAISFLRSLNTRVYKEFPTCQTVAEESTAWPMVSRPTHVGGLGFGMKWNMGWMHDTLEYFVKDPVHRKYHHNMLTFNLLYAFHENFVLSLSHDEVVHGKRSLLDKMPGDRWQKLANLRLLYGHMYSQPGKKLIFMGGEIGQWREWNHETSLDWHLLEEPDHRGLQKWLRDLNQLYRSEPALHARDFSPDGFQWVDCWDSEQSTLSLLRHGTEPKDSILVSLNLTPVPRYDFRIGAPRGGFWREMLNSDAEEYGGSGVVNVPGAEAEEIPWHGQPWSVRLTLPPLGAIFLKLEARAEEGKVGVGDEPQPTPR